MLPMYTTQLPTPENSQFLTDSDTENSILATEPINDELITSNTALRASEISSTVDVSNILAEGRRTRSSHSVLHHVFSSFISTRDKRIHRD
jgi:hypothetical protein